MRLLWNKLRAPLRKFSQDIRRDKLRKLYAGRTPLHNHDDIKDIAVIGYVHAKSGLGKALNYEVEYLRQQGYRIQTFDLKSCIGSSKQAQELRAELLTYKKWIIWENPNSIYLRFFLNFEPKELDHIYIIGYWVTEMEVMPLDWQYAETIIDEIWTASKFCKQSMAPFFSKDIAIIPHKVPASPHIQEMDRKNLDLRDDQFLGLNISNIRACAERKNIKAIIKTWTNAFGDDDDYQLRLKLSYGKENHAYMQQVRGMIKDYPNIQLDTHNYTDDDLIALIKTADIYIALHRSEGYGLPIEEALINGTPAMATAWSGNMDFMDQYDHSILVDYEFTAYKDPQNRYSGENHRWAEAKIDDAVQKLQLIAQQK